MKTKYIALFIFLLIAADQILKIWVKTHMTLDQTIIVCPDWFQLRFIENNGAAFGMQIDSAGNFDWGKLLLSIFRITMIGALVFYLKYLIKNQAPKTIITAIALIFAGAVGNVIDSAFYGLLFSASTPLQTAHFGGHYAGLLMGKVVDMFYFPLFQWNSVPSFLRFLVDYNNYFFGPIFNLADAYISVAVVLLLCQYKYFK
ncbi:MAG: signal peptidase II [Alistipes sp.]|nr:signal peptidase II [Alistipes sp.]